MKKTALLSGYIAAAALSSGCADREYPYDASGTFEATEVIVSAEANGRIMELNLEEGERLSAGETIGFIDTLQLYLTRVQLQAQNRAVGSRRQDIAKQIAALKEQIATQKREKERFEGLLKSHAATQKQVDDLASAVAVLQKQLDAQISTLENSNTGVTAESAALDAQIARIDDQLYKCRITSPIGGVVLTKYAQAGEFASTGRPLFKIADTDHMYLRAYLSGEQLAEVKIGQRVTVFSDYGDDNIRRYEGTVSWISQEAEFTPKNIQTKNERANLVYAVKIAVANDGFLKIGTYGHLLLDK